MTEADLPAGMRLKELAGWNQTAADWQRFLRASPRGCFVAESDGRVCGTATTIVYEERFAWIGMVLVDPDYRGRGIGTQLLTKTIEHLDALRVPTLKLDATPQGKPIYAGLGFRTEYELERWVLKRGPRHVEAQRPASAQERAAALEPAASPAVCAQPDVEEIIQADREVFGADRGALLNSLHHEAPALALASKSRGKLQGYALGRRGSRADHLGPWVAGDEAAAGSLLAEFLRRSGRDTIFVDLMKSNLWACELAHSTGFEFSRHLTRMYRGPNHYPGRPEGVCGILGPEFG
jgi:GNAT superfamily N-acetyltransferase